MRSRRVLKLFSGPFHIAPLFPGIIPNLDSILPRLRPSHPFLAQRVFALLIRYFVLCPHNYSFRRRHDSLLTLKHLLSLGISLFPAVDLAICSNLSSFGRFDLGVIEFVFVVVDVCYCGVDFLSCDSVDDSDQDGSDGGDAAGDEHNPEISAIQVSKIRKNEMTAFLAQMSR